ncbi:MULTISPECIES: hypothetical protein [unclassified Pantoea]|uniref:hypothetical protein n=1 Tax=unclassified Pantoea TaxID=2630326 RepID=UPI00206697F0|nr:MULTISPECIES: hypothetical protein [unclassified Pantoea]MDU5474017.1 hypothetical protein [Pantoea sp.]DAI70356.1 MAG TPA: virion morphogenesis protein [Bacteriophage sp.]
MSGLTVRADNAAAVLESLRQLTGMDVLVGIPTERAAREGSPINNAEIGYLQSTGATVEIDGETITLPPRPFLDMGIEDTKPRTTAHLEAAARAALGGNIEGALLELESAGQIARDGAKAVIGSGDRLHPLSEKTLKRREREGITGDKPLYAHGHLLNSITYVVRKK